ncbi:hypothetical protein SGFS_064940 [Streptomyces graminofaciens]|uniref:Uncharacterized protein n=1 Tax=Streptomyces graminofaciens TaxID=68212 RepID=A0ABN5VP20_9ACTN|nr:hypothetical protein [Streptomyces graminofaciens]BBC35200.1 hypothetical protein SGFS_064940 [Streptomyces graminofaciens]
MAMVGLFWVTEDGVVYVGSEPEGYGRGVRLTAAGVEGLGTDQGGSWAWGEVGGVEVRDMKIRPSTSRLLVGAAVDLVVSTISGGGDSPGAFEVHLDTADGTVELEAYVAAAAGGYAQSEYDLSVALLKRLADGTADLGALEEWGRGAEGTPRREEREALLRKWAS